MSNCTFYLNAMLQIKNHAYVEMCYRAKHTMLSRVADVGKLQKFRLVQASKLGLAHLLANIQGTKASTTPRFEASKDENHIDIADQDT